MHLLLDCHSGNFEVILVYLNCQLTHWKYVWCFKKPAPWYVFNAPVLESRRKLSFKPNLPVEQEWPHGALGWLWMVVGWKNKTQKNLAPSPWKPFMKSCGRCGPSSLASHHKLQAERWWWLHYQWAQVILVCNYTQFSLGNHWYIN